MLSSAPYWPWQWSARLPLLVRTRLPSLRQRHRPRPNTAIQVAHRGPGGRLAFPHDAGRKSSADLRRIESRDGGHRSHRNLCNRDRARRADSLVGSRSRFPGAQGRHPAQRGAALSEREDSPRHSGVIHGRGAPRIHGRGAPRIHGIRQHQFPQALGLASAWEPDLVHQVFTAAGNEAGARGAWQVFSPVLDIARDPRWGRTEETYGEDPFLASRMGVAAITGLQGNSFLINRHHVVATAKHFAVHGQPEGGTNTAPGNYCERIIRENFLVPFQAAVEDAQVGRVMASYNEIDGIPSHINHWLLDRVLRQEWGFRGYLTSDGDDCRCSLPRTRLRPIRPRRRDSRFLPALTTTCRMAPSTARCSGRSRRGLFRKLS